MVEAAETLWRSNHAASNRNCQSEAPPHGIHDAQRSTRQAAAVSDPEISVGSRLRELRNERSLSIRALAERSGLNVNTFSLIENGKTSPSVSTLQQIAAALEVPITAFFETNAPKNSIAHIMARITARVWRLRMACWKIWAPDYQSGRRALRGHAGTAREQRRYSDRPYRL